MRDWHRRGLVSKLSASADSLGVWKRSFPFFGSKMLRLRSPGTPDWASAKSGSTNSSLDFRGSYR